MLSTCREHHIAALHSSRVVTALSMGSGGEKRTEDVPHLKAKPQTFPSLSDFGSCYQLQQNKGINQGRGK